LVARLYFTNTAFLIFYLFTNETSFSTTWC
jgi:hypothetical protein